MKSTILIYLVASFCHIHGQQYRLVPTCSNEPLDPNNPVALKGDKGDNGIPGKAGPPGFGVKGVKGEIGNCTRFSRDLNARLDNIEATLQRLIDRIPTTCSESNVNGVEVLRNGNKAYCDQHWRVFQRRFDGSVSFDRSWQDYKMGFGNVSGEFWMGLEQIHQLTKSGNCRLRVDLWDFDDNFAYAEYSSFSIDDEASNYVLRVNGYNGTAGNSLIDSGSGLHNNQPFTTFDRDNDNSARNCAAYSDNVRGGWWHNNCFRAPLNNQWGRSVGRWTRIIWYAWKGASEALKATTMKIRCK